MSDKLSKEERKGLKSPDAFVNWGRKLMGLVSQNPRKVAPFVVAFVVAGFGWYGYTVWRDGQDEKAWEAYYEAHNQKEPERWAALEKMYATRSSSRAGFYAAIKLADHYFQLSKDSIEKNWLTQAEAAAKAKKGKGGPDLKMTLGEEKENSAKAVEWYSKALGYGRMTQEERQLVQLNLGNAYELAGDWKKAEENYQTAAGVTGGAKALGMLSLARVAEIGKDNQKATQLYEKIVQEFSNTEYERMAKNYLRRLNGKLVSETF